jgi:hypothetical protein
MAEFLDETEALQTNVEAMKNLSESLATFNESFASWLYVMNMNALTTDWMQVCCCLLMITQGYKAPRHRIRLRRLRRTFLLLWQKFVLVFGLLAESLHFIR